MRADSVSGWYARLDRICSDKSVQIWIWLDKWEESLKNGQPIAALLPREWPTLPASLLTDPGRVLDQLLARHDAETDGRSPRSSHPTPPKLADSVIIAEMLEFSGQANQSPTPSRLPIDALPPGFRAQLEKLNLSSHLDKKQNSDNSESIQKAIELGERTTTGVPLPYADPATGGGLFAARIIRRHAELSKGFSNENRYQDTIRLLEGFQLLDCSELAVKATRRRLLLELVRHGLANFGNEENGLLSRKTVENLLKKGVRLGDGLLGEWPWDIKPRSLIVNPPWLRIKDRFRGIADGSILRRELGETLRNASDKGVPRFSTMRGNVNLYRLFIERSLQLLSKNGQMKIIVPDSVLREQSSAPLRKLLVEKYNWSEIWFFEVANQLFPGVTQGVIVLTASRDQHSTTELEVVGPIDTRELRRDGAGVAASVPRFVLDRERWAIWSNGNWGVPRLPRCSYDRQNTIEILDNLSIHPRLGEADHWLSIDGDVVRVRVGEVDQTSWSKEIRSWRNSQGAVPFIRGLHFASDEKGSIFLQHPALQKDSLLSKDIEKTQSLWVGDIKPSLISRLACQAIVTSQQNRRLRWVVVPPGCVLGNSVNHLELPDAMVKQLENIYGSLENGLDWLKDRLNDPRLDVWARAWAANNNVNNYELEMLPLVVDDEVISGTMLVA